MNLEGWAEGFMLSNQPRGAAQRLTTPLRKSLRATVGLTDPVNVGKFDVFFDDLKLSRPIRFRGLPVTSNALKAPLVFIGKCRESHQRDLYDSIEKGDFPRWTMYVQILTEEQAAALPYHPFDLSKVWYHKDAPLMEVGVLELNRNPENYFAEVEQAAFNPANVVPGIGFSPDKMLQGRLFSYGDAQRYRLGVNHHLIPVNKARCPFHSYHRDGAMRVDGNYGSTLGYEPNSSGEWQDQPDFREPPLALSGAAAHWNAREDDSDYYTQPGKLFRLMTPEQQDVLFGNTARAIGDAPKEVQVRHIGNCSKADPEYGKGVAKALGIDLTEVNI